MEPPPTPPSEPNTPEEKPSPNLPTLRDMHYGRHRRMRIPQLIMPPREEPRPANVHYVVRFGLTLATLGFCGAMTLGVVALGLASLDEELHDFFLWGGSGVYLGGLIGAGVCLLKMRSAPSRKWFLAYAVVASLFFFALFFSSELFGP